MYVAVTGASGLLGSYLVQELQRRGHTVLPLSRPRFALGESIAPDIFLGVEALIHCAYDFQAFGWQEIKRVNVDGSIRLHQLATDAGIKRQILISSIAAFSECRSLYGRGKLEVEAFVRNENGVVIRPGLIYGDPGGRGMFGALGRAVHLPVVPIFGDGSHLFYLSHVEDLTNLIADTIEHHENQQRKIIFAANPSPITFRDLLLAISRKETGRTPTTVKVPAVLGLALLRALERIGMRPRFRSDSLLSMIHFDRNPALASDPEVKQRFRIFQ
jgi:nucleoside-diphosphate-sugar epimerase